LILIVVLVSISGCRKETNLQQSFYYWKTVFRLNQEELQVLKIQQIKRLYIRYFDVVIDKGVPQPESTIIFKDSIPINIKIIPVIFITNQVLETSTDDQIPVLAEKIYKRISSINQVHHIPIDDIPEIQMDCDWNKPTREKYFRLLDIMRQYCIADNIHLSATLRLHQLKYQKRTGIPPVDRAVLMCYNVGDLTEYGSQNSILDIREVKNYIQNSGLYPVPIDIAFPLFSWGVCFRNKQYRGLIRGLSKKDMSLSCFKEIAPNLYYSDSTFYMYGASIIKGDHIRVEEPTSEEIYQSAKIIASRLKISGHIIWYHLDSLFLQKFTSHELQKVTDLFH
jgi:hypothetical protein